MHEWEERWSHGEHSGSEPSPVLVEAISDVDPGRALDLASGAGRNALFLAELGWNVTGVDASEAAIRIANMRAGEMGVSLDARKLDLEKDDLPFQPESFDLIAMFFYLQRSLFPLIPGWLRRGGLFVAAIHMHDERDGIHPMNADYLLQPDELKTAFAGFEIVSYREGDPRDDQHRRLTAEIIARRV